MIDYGLIMSAGMGTRMGPIGQLLPKVLWPLFETNILDLQIKRLRELGCRSILVNAHFLHEQVGQYICDTYGNQVTFFYEPLLYGSGGTVNELVAQGKIPNSGSLLYSAGDQFYFFDGVDLQQVRDDLKGFHTMLIGIEVKNDGKYNELVLDENNLLKGIRPKVSLENEKGFSRKESIITYSGLGLVNLERVQGKKGHSEFFQTVASFGGENKVLLPSFQEYWDFGTVENYYTSIKKIHREFTDQLPSRFQEFLSKYLLVSVEKNEDFLLFKTFHGKDFKVIIHSKKKEEKAGIFYDGLFHEVAS